MANYIRWEGKNRETGTRTQVIDLLHADSEFEAERDADGKVVNRWMALCLDHATLVTSHNLETALALSAHPLQWCGTCNGDEGQTNPEAHIAATAKQTVAVWGPNLRGSSEAMHVHTPGCADTKKGIYKGAERPWNIEVTNEQEIVEAIYGDMIAESPDSSWTDYRSDVRIFPCVTGL